MNFHFFKSFINILITAKITANSAGYNIDSLSYCKMFRNKATANLNKTRKKNIVLYYIMQLIYSKKCWQQN